MYIMAASTFFHRNVLLLTQVIPTSADFKTHFYEGMFYKPNTVGFMHLSQYLLVIYDEERFKKLIQWPLISKKMEVKYRNDVKEYLSIIANENPDVEFPPILASYLISAHGRKFTDIMWKLSIVVLRTYIKRNCSQNIFYAPRPSSADELIKATLQRINKDTISSIMSYRRNMIKMREMSKIVIAEEEEALANIKHEFFENKQYLSQLVLKVPVNSNLRECLANVEDTEIIEFWKQHIIENVAYINKKIMTLKNVETLSNRIINMILSRKSATAILDAELFTKVDSSSISVLPLSENVQYLYHHLYVNNKLMLLNFIRLFNLLLCQVYQCLRKNELEDLSNCFLQIEACREDMRLAIRWFQNQRTTIESTTNNIKFDYQKNINQTYQENISPIKNVIFLQSPTIQINTNCCNEGNDVLKRLELTPVEGVHKSLFSRYKQQHGNNNKSVLQLRTNLLVSRINFDDTISLNIGDKIHQSSMCISKTSSSPATHNGKYSRLFFSHTRKQTDIGKSLESCSRSMISIPHVSIANSTAIGNAVGEIHNVSSSSLGNTNETEEDRTTNAKDNKYNTTKSRAKTRRSISDLVQRYKKVLEISNQASPYTEK